MRAISELTRAEALGIDGVLFDLDDTVLDHGLLTQRAFSALWRLRAAGLFGVAVTGRPALWGTLLASQWPVSGVITENGAVAYYRDGERGPVVEVDSVSAAERHSRRERLLDLAARLLVEFPALRETGDVRQRLSDHTFDIGEFHRLSPEVIDAVSTRARSLAARVSCSSIHLHISLDAEDKASGALRFLRQRFGVDATDGRRTWAFIGDSGNDAPCFACFFTTAGVGNLTGDFSVRPRYRTGQERGAGFAEFVETLLARRSAAGQTEGC